MADKTGIDGPSFSKWKSGQVPKAETVARFARAYDASVLKAFVAAGFLTSSEAGERPVANPDLTQLTNDELLELVRARMTGGSGERADSSTATKEAGSGRPLRSVDGLDMEAARDVGREGSVAKARRKQDQSGEPPTDDPDDMEPR